MPADGGQLLFKSKGKISFVDREPSSERYFKRLVSAHEFINGQENIYFN